MKTGNFCRAFGLVAMALAVEATPAMARTWEQVIVPGAYCGNGEPYEIYISRKDPQKIAFTFQGGGACWNGLTCWGKTKTIFGLNPKHRPPGDQGTRSEDPALSPIPEYTIVYFPYCTGDVFLGGHVATYHVGWKFKKRKAYHYGRIDVEQAMKHLAATSGLDLKGADKIVVYGESAGAIGALYHVNTIAPYLRADASQEKILISDSPGLHFGPTFWFKFTQKQIADFRVALGSAGVKLRYGDGNVVPFAVNMCHKYPDWRFGYLQSSMDGLMAIFGDSTPFGEAARVYGPRGLFHAAKDPNDNCAAWIPDSVHHTYLTTSDAPKQHWKLKVTPREFAWDVIEGLSMRSYP